MTDDTSRRDRITAARAALAAARDADPKAVDRFNQRISRLDAARKRERERFEHLVLGKPRPRPTKTARKKAARKGPALSDPAIDAALTLREDWSHKQGTPETQAWAASVHQGAIAQLHANGTLDVEEVEWATEIANVYRSIEADVAVTVASLEARVDNGGGGRNLVGEGVRRVRLHYAYTLWRDQLPRPKQMVLDMIVGDAIGYTVAAKRYRVHNRKAKRYLLDAIAAWPGCVERAYRSVSRDDVAAANGA